MDISVPYYEDMTRYSNSNIGWFIKNGPAYLHSMLIGKEDGLKGAFLDRGTMIHMSFLQPEEYKKTYRVLEVSKPQSRQQQVFVDELKSSTELIENEKLISAYRNAYASANKSDNTILARAKELKEQLRDYIDVQESDKTNISFADKALLDKIHISVNNHKLASYLLDDKNFEEVHNEFHINWEFPKEYEGIHLPCKSLIDRCIFNWTKKEIILIDLKTTANIHNFEHSVETYDYCRQLAYYWMAILWYMKNEKKLDINDDEWKFKTYIIAMSTNDKEGSVRVFNITEQQLNNRIDTINQAIEQISWHDKYNQWDYTKEYYDGDGSEKLDL
jgi:hypothetical protein